METKSNDQLGSDLSSNSDRATENDSQQTEGSDQNTDKQAESTEEVTDRNSENGDQPTENTDQPSDQGTDKPEEKPESSDQPTEETPIVKISEVRDPKSNGTDKIPRKSNERTYTFRATPEIDDVLVDIQTKFECGKGQSVNLLLEHLASREPEKVIEEKEVIKEVEVVKEVARPSMPGEVICKLDDDQIRIIDSIIDNRKHMAAKRSVDMTESRADILIKGLFIRDRLFNLDNAFFTGLKKSDVKS